MVKTQFSRRGDEGASKFFRDGVSDCMNGTEGGAEAIFCTRLRLAIH